MKKIPSVWKRDFSKKGAPYLDEVTPGCEWVMAGEGVATRKWDGAACRIDDDGMLWARYDAKHGKQPPQDFEPCGQPDSETGHWPGWVPAIRPQDQWIREAAKPLSQKRPGTYEAVGPKINGNPERLEQHVAIRHTESAQYADAPRTFDGLRAWLEPLDIEGVVFQHPDGRMAKATKQGFGLKR